MEVGEREIINLSLHCHHHRWAAMRAILMFHNCEGQSHKTFTIQDTDTTFEVKGEPKQIRAEVPLLTSLTPDR